jgi:hypothetical protein
MNDLLPCLYALVLMAGSAVAAAAVGFWAGRWREQLSLLELLKPEH